MKILLFSGDSKRHIYLHQKIIQFFTSSVVGIVCEHRKNNIEIDSDILRWHFNQRDMYESKSFGELSYNKSWLPNNIEILHTDKDNLNNDNTINFVKKLNPDICIVFGTHLLKKELFQYLPEHTYNLHLGLSPEYKGSATIFWSLYMQEPNKAAGTIHKITSKIDGGDIAYKIFPILCEEDNVHTLTNKIICNAAFKFIDLINKIRNKEIIQYEEQKKNGKLFLTTDFKVEHLYNIVNVTINPFNNKIEYSYKPIPKHYLESYGR